VKARLNGFDLEDGEAIEFQDDSGAWQLAEIVSSDSKDGAKTYLVSPPPIYLPF